MWVMDHFQVLPTDPRIKELSDEQAEILYLNHARLPDAKEIKKRYWEEQKKKQELESFPEEDLRKMGYTEELIEKIKGDIVNG